MHPARPIRRWSVCALVSLAVAGVSAPAAIGQSDEPSSLPTTPIPAHEDPSQPPASQPDDAPGPIVADAGTLLGIVRLLPKTVPTGTIVDDPEFEEALPPQSVAEVGMGRAVAQANSTSYFAHERSVAESSPIGVSLLGRVPTLPGALAQTALPDHPEPVTNSFVPATPLDPLLRLGLVDGSAHARWDERTGPCVGTISDASTSLGSVSAVNALPELPEAPEVRRLGGLLDGQQPDADGLGSLLHVPDALSARSTVRLVDVPGQQGQAVRSTSSVQVASVRLFAGTPVELRIDVVSRPTLTATATGDPATSTVEYAAPVLRVSQGGRELGVLDAARPELDVPLGALDLGLLRLSIGEFDQATVGTEVRGVARMFDLQLLRGHPVGIETSLVRISFGEQVVRAGAPEGGVECEAAAPPGAAPAAPASGPTPGGGAPTGPPLAETSGAYHAVPLFWTGTALLLLGAVLVAAVPRRR
ncbi:hypothetical protein [Saccharopolyspora sp. CA-218241]|uniref:hypothetical protein n=1 Tax=Saccharopolyspora sp. CA-218241 TaxID=3240027 RepID=UPI003D955C66